MKMLPENGSYKRRCLPLARRASKNIACILILTKPPKTLHASKTIACLQKHSMALKTQRASYCRRCLQIYGMPPIAVSYYITYYAPVCVLLQSTTSIQGWCIFDTDYPSYVPSKALECTQTFLRRSARNPVHRPDPLPATHAFNSMKKGRVWERD